MTDSKFIYYNFALSRGTLESYIKNTVSERKHTKWKNKQLFGYHSPLTNSIIEAIASNNVTFNATDVEMLATVEKLITECGYGQDGIYTETAHLAMQKLCVARGMSPDAITLYDHTLSGQIKRGREKVKSFFGFGKKVVTPQPVVQAVLTNTGTAQQNKHQTRKTPESLKQERQAEIQEPIRARKTMAHQPEDNNTNKKTLVGTIIAGAALLGLTALFSADKSRDNSNDAQETKKKIVNVASTPKHSMRIILNYNTKQTLAFHQAMKPVDMNKIPKSKKSVNSQQLAAINDFCDSSLDILMGTKKRDALYKKIQDQVNRGIFAIPAGMSVQRIAHAMEMSRIYEGHSVILDALNSDKKLTAAQQDTFNAHIDGIGIRGEKLQKRMAKKHKLSKHSKFDKSSYAQQRAHIKNLKQLRQMRIK